MHISNIACQYVFVLLYYFILPARFLVNVSDKYHFCSLQFNYSSGQPAPESITDKIYGNTLSVCDSLIMHTFHFIIDIPSVDGIQVL